jgi:predicted MFS family arabinose efflux permease
MALFVITVFTTAGSIHFQTPMLGRMAAEFQASPAAAGWVATLSFGGYFAGTVFLVPLGDRYDKRTLVLTQMACLVAALLAMAAAPSLPLLALAAFAVGIACTMSQHIVPVVSELAPPAARGRIIGTVLSGLFVGILFARLGGGIVASHMSWRWMYVYAAAMVALMAGAMYWRMPASPPNTTLSYAELVRSMGRLWLDYPKLRNASTMQFLLGIGYGGFWATVASMLASLHGLGPTAAGLMAIPGAAGVLVSRPAGRWMDASGARPVVRTGICLMTAAFAAFAFAPAHIGAAVLGAILLDCGLRSAMVANQTMVIGAMPEAAALMSATPG